MKRSCNFTCQGILFVAYITFSVSGNTQIAPVRIEQRETKISQRGEQVKTFTLANDKLNLSISTLGASITSLYAPDINGEYSDVVLGFQDHEKEAQSSSSPYFGCIVGRVANRIADGKFTLDGKEYVLARNNGPNHLHGGEDGFDKRVWSVSRLLPDGILLELHSPDGDQVARSFYFCYRTYFPTIEVMRSPASLSRCPPHEGRHPAMHA